MSEVLVKGGFEEAQLMQAVYLICLSAAWVAGRSSIL